MPSNSGDDGAIGRGLRQRGSVRRVVRQDGCSVASPPFKTNELAFYDVVTENEPAVEGLGEGIVAPIARDLVDVMRRDVRSDWTARVDVRAELRASIS
ncbi:type I restriction enzyme endonuclease domain-containing protein [Marisediminicola antarctica]|nr:type I restriction enzyme endonuclease domain-containing protein [Marisediminicola antarctica]